MYIFIKCGSAKQYSSSNVLLRLQKRSIPIDAMLKGLTLYMLFTKHAYILVYLIVLVSNGFFKQVHAGWIFFYNSSIWMSYKSLKLQQWSLSLTCRCYHR